MWVRVIYSNAEPLSLVSPANLRSQLTGMVSHRNPSQAGACHCGGVAAAARGPAVHRRRAKQAWGSDGREGPPSRGVAPERGYKFRVSKGCLPWCTAATNRHTPPHTAGTSTHAHRGCGARAHEIWTPLRRTQVPIESTHANTCAGAQAGESTPLPGFTGRLLFRAAASLLRGPRFSSLPFLEVSL